MLQYTTPKARLTVGFFCWLHSAYCRLPAKFISQIRMIESLRVTLKIEGDLRKMCQCGTDALQKGHAK